MSRVCGGPNRAALTTRIARDKGWSFVIENKAGAGGVIAKAAPDGHTLLLDLIPEWTMDAAARRQILLDNPNRLYSFPLL